MKTIVLPLAVAAALAITACETGSPVSPPAVEGLRLYSAVGGSVARDITGGRIGTSPAQEFQFFAKAHLSNDDEPEVSSYTQWSSSNTAVLTVSETGLVTTVGAGEAQVIGTYLGHTAAVTIQVQAE